MLCTALQQHPLSLLCCDKQLNPPRPDDAFSQDAGSAEQFKKVDHDYVEKSAELAKAAGARYYGLVSSGGANANLWASDLKPFHGLLYAKTKGRVSPTVV